MAGSHRAGGGQGGTSGTRRLRRPPGPAGKGEGRGADGKSPRPAPPDPSFHFLLSFLYWAGPVSARSGGWGEMLGPSPSLLAPLPLSPPRRRLLFYASTSALSFTPSRARTPLHPERGPSGCRRLTGRTGAHSRCPGGRTENGRRSGDGPALPSAPLRTKAAAGGAAAGAARAAPSAPCSG